MTRSETIQGRIARVRGFDVELFEDGFSLIDQGDVVLNRRYAGLSMSTQAEALHFLIAEARAWANECRAQM